jgi:hypothetical protein
MSGRTTDILFPCIHLKTEIIGSNLHILNDPLSNHMPGTIGFYQETQFAFRFIYNSIPKIGLINYRYTRGIDKLLFSVWNSVLLNELVKYSVLHHRIKIISGCST